MSTTSSMPSVTGPVKEAMGYAKEEAGEKLGKPDMAQEGRDLRNRGRMEQGKDVLVGTPGLNDTHMAGGMMMQGKPCMCVTKAGGTGSCKCNASECADCKKTGCLGAAGTIPSAPVLQDIKAFNKGELHHVETVDKTHTDVFPTGDVTSKPATNAGHHTVAGTASTCSTSARECHQMKSDAELMKAKDSALPITERVGHGLTAVAEKTKALFSSSSTTSSSSTK